VHRKTHVDFLTSIHAVKMMLKIAIYLGLLWCAHGAVYAQGRDLLPASDSQVIEKLAPRVERKPQTPVAAAIAAKQAITLARESAQARYLGRAQAVLQPWWDKADAPTELAVLQATVQQSRHEFAAAHAVLERVLQREPQHAQALLTLATLERVAANYPAAERACAQLRQTTAVLYAQACSLETQSLQGKHRAAQQGFASLLANAADPATQSWLWSLAGENEERAGHDDKAYQAYQTSMQLATDNYTALAAADVLLRTGQAAAVLPWLSKLPDSEAALLRRAYAYKQLQNPQWQVIAKELELRFTALEQRGDAPVLHAREQALAYLWLAQDGVKALQSAQLNLSLQKEPLDWWIALQSAQLARDSVGVQKIVSDIAAVGLRDSRLALPIKTVQK
jgi:hypothetical protein